MIANDNPFRPFDLPATRGLAAQREALVSRIVGLIIDDSQPAFAVITGQLGVGKSTIARILLPAALKRRKIPTVLIQGSPFLSPDALLSAVGTAVGFPRQRLLREFGLAVPNVSQAAGRVRRSRDVTIAQTVAAATIDNSAELSAAEIPAVLSAFAKRLRAAPVIILDQAEHLFTGGQTRALALIEGLLYATTTLDARVVIAIRDRFLHELLPLAGGFADLTRRIVPITGLDEADARGVIEAGTTRFGVVFTAPLVRRLLDRVAGADRRIWPIALQATARELADRARASQRPATARDLSAIGDVPGALASAIESVLAVVPEQDRGDALYLLDVIARSAQTAGPVTSEELNSVLPVFPAEDLERLVDMLVGLRLVERSRNALSPAHDAIAVGVAFLRRSQPTELDRVVQRWAAGDSVFDLLSPDDLHLILAGERLPLVYVVFALECVFESLPEQVESLRTRLQSLSHSRTSAALVRFLRTKARRRGHSPTFTSRELFVLFLDDRPESLDAALAALATSNTTAGATWDDTRSLTALHLARPTHLASAALRVGRGLERSHSTLRALTLYFEQHPGGVDKRVLQVLWAGPQNRLRPEVLRLTLAILPDMARDLARLNITSTTVFLRAASMEILILSGDHSILEAALSDESAVVRRRAVYAIGEAMNGADSKALLIRASLDESPLVREAVLEVAGRGQIRAVRDTVVKALADPYDFVRESAVYALKEVDSPVNAANMVAALIRDPSPQVREAAFRVLERGGRFPPDEVTIGALRDPRPAVAASAVNALGDVTSHGIDDALIEWLARPDAPSSAVMAALRVVGQHHPKAAAEVIARYLDNGNPDLVAEAVIALQRIGLPETAQWLAPLVTHPSTDVRERTVYALAQIGGPGAPEALSLAVWDGAATIRARAIYALARLQYTAARDLVAAIPSGSREVDAAKLYFENTVGKARKHNHAKRSRSV